MSKFDKIVKDKELLKEMDMNQILTIVHEKIIEEESKEKPNKKVLDDASEIIASGTVKRYIQFLINCQINNTKILEVDYQNLYLIVYILQAIYNYSETESPISDYDYDRLYSLLKSFGNEIVTTPVIGSKISHHQYLSLPGTLKKIYILDEEDRAANDSRKSLAEWVKSCEKIIYERSGKTIDFWEEEIYVFPKWDGVSITFEVNEHNELLRALTRGDTEANEAQDVTFVFAPIWERIKDKSMNGKAYGLKTEVMMRDDDLSVYNKKFGKNYKSTRSIVSSIINSDTTDGRENLLEVVGLRTSILNEDNTEQLQTLASNAFERPYIRCRVKDTKAIRNFAMSHKVIDGLHTDGAVLYLIDESLREILGRKDHKNQYEIAFKFNEDIAYSKIKNVEYNLTTFGRIFPKAIFEPVKMKGNTVQDASLGSIARSNELKLAKGDQVKILYEIVPYLVWDDEDPNCKRSGNKMIKPPTVCPECGDPLEINPKGTIITCINPECPCRKRGKILNYIQKMGISDFGEATVNDLYKHGLVKEIEDLYRLKDHYNELIQLPNYDTKTINRLINEVENKRSIPASVFMGSIGIECIGKTIFEKIFSTYTIDDLLEFSEDMRLSKLVIINGIGDLQAKKILEGIRDNRKMIRKLLDKYVTVSYDKPKTGKFTAVFHKIRSASITKVIEDYGGVVKDNLTRGTDFLIVPDNFAGPSSTSDKAKKYGVPIIEISKVPNYLTEMNL